MTEAVHSWLSSRGADIPALEVFHRLALNTLEDHSKTLRDLADVIALDPGMSLSVYSEVNGKLHSSGKHPVESIHAALSLLGDSSLADLVMQHKVLDQAHPQAAHIPAYHQLYSRSFHLLSQLQYFISMQGVHSIYEIRSAALLHNIAEFAACLFDHEHYLEYLARFEATGSSVNSARSVFGFDFFELGRTYVEKFQLPELVEESFHDNPSTGRKARLIQLAADISHQAESGWYHSSMKATQEVCAAYLNLSIDVFNKTLHQAAIQSAKDCPLTNVLPAAARLIMLPDSGNTSAAKQTAEPATPTPGSEFETRVKTLLVSDNPSSARLLNLLLDHLHDDLHLSRVSLMLLSKNQRKLGTRAGKGIDEHSLIRTLVIDMTRMSLLKTLLTKPQAIWIEPETYSRYEAMLPAKFKACFLHESFFLMSLHVAGKPTGIIFGDRAQAVTPLDKFTFIQFKSAILLTAKALNQLAQHKAGNGAA